MKEIDPMSQKPGRRIKAVITLVGAPESGKTATLRYLYYLLTKKVPLSKTDDFREFFSIRSSRRNILFAISTVGDLEEEVELNWIFFRNKWVKDFKTLTLKNLIRPREDNEKDAGKVIVIGTTHLNDGGAVIHNANISILRRMLSFVLYVQKKKANKDDNAILDQKGLQGFLKANPQATGWTPAMIGDAIRTAVLMKNQIEIIINNI